MLLGGDYKNGWGNTNGDQEREQHQLPHAIPDVSSMQWQIRLDKTNQLLLVSEQGLGDTLQFMRYAIALRDQGISVSLSAQPKLHSLIQASGIDLSPPHSKSNRQ